MVALALGAASWGLLGLLDGNLIRTAQTDAERQAIATAGLAAEGRLDPVLAPDRGTDFLQVVDAQGRVLAASPNLAGRPALSTHRSGTPGTVRGTWNGSPVREEHRQRVVQVTTPTAQGLVTVYAGTSLREADAADETITAALAITVPLLVLTVAVVTWRVTGWVLRPVEAIRAEVAEISDRDLHRRVPVPNSQDEVARLAVTMNTTLDRLESAGIRQRQFIADASLELRSPITVLRTQLEVAQAHPDPALWGELVSGALEDTVRLQDLASDLLLLARLDAAEPPPTAAVDLTEVVREAARSRRQDRISVHMEIAPEVTVRGSTLWLARLVTNLLDNAQRHADHRVLLSLRIDEAHNTAVLEVGDDGPGIPVTDRERVFERFTRLDDARSRHQGGTVSAWPSPVTSPPTWAARSASRTRERAPDSWPDFRWTRPGARTVRGAPPEQGHGQA
ncbi:sensor histidine kinase [Streptomyces sp. H39-C1]|uniref:sensor histidine kinase n=1 Tax=Streptomyces sp. H39-C1 TaxID=3004355 RepID=UPI0022AF795D|nr:HAMP domain-containing sensor histidine kinase [Streptomyces sp. H39-C1]MCZ4101778.1 HAMP domain-containing sensor histidine kinase [Streptomyces sp. H39-C1]